MAARKASTRGIGKAGGEKSTRKAKAAKKAAAPPKPPKGRKKWLESLASRARELEETRKADGAPPPPGLESTTEERVNFIAEEMSSGRWREYVSRAPLAVAWGVSDSRVRQLATEAHRLVAFDPEARERHRFSLAAYCAQQRERAARMLNEVTGLPDFGNVLKAAELEAKFIGIELANTNKVELTGKDGGPVAITLDDIDETIRAVEANSDGSGDPGEPAGA